MFKHYLYVSGTTVTLKNHFDKLAHEALSRVSPISPKVLDIACNDGSLLDSFKSMDAEVYGVDPAENLREITEKKKIPVVVDYWSDKILNQLPKLDVITATNVFAHVDDAKSFLETCIKALDVNGVIVLEFPYALKLIKKTEFDTVYHEHLSYFLVHSMKELCKRVGLTIIDIVETPIHGGSIRFILSREITTAFRGMSRYISNEKQFHLTNITQYENFQNKVDLIAETLLDTLSNYENESIKTIGYGASAKGNTILNYAKIKNLKYIVDDNKLKWNYLTPGMDIPIKPSSSIREEGELAILVLSWNFLREIQKRIVDLRGKDKSTTLITYIPSVREINL